MTAQFICPECSGGFPTPSRVDTGRHGLQHACPWCGETATYDLIDTTTND